MANFTGTAGDDDLIGTNGNDAFDLSQGGDDRARGRAGDDLFIFGAAHTIADEVDGGEGFDTLSLDGDYSAGTTLNMFGIEEVTLGANFSYAFTVFDAAVVGGATLRIDASGLTGGHTLSFNAVGETAGAYDIDGSGGDDSIATGAGDDRIRGGEGADVIVLRAGHDRVDGGIGSDTIHCFGTGGFEALDRIDGGDGHDTLRLQGDYSAGLTIKPKMMPNIEVLTVLSSFDYTLNLSRLAPVDAPIVIDGTELIEADVLTADAGGALGVFGFSMLGGPGDDVLIGGTRNDSLQGGAGADRMSAGEGANAFHYNEVTESTGAQFDTLVAFDTHTDIISPGFNAGVTIVALDSAVKHGALSLNTLDADLEAAIGADELGADNAVLFRPDEGTLAGKIFLLVEGNGVAGYQAGEDMVVRLNDPEHLRDLAVSNFSPAG